MLSVPKLNSKPVYFWRAARVTYVQVTLKRNCQSKNPMLTEAGSGGEAWDFSPGIRNSLLYVVETKGFLKCYLFFQLS